MPEAHDTTISRSTLTASGTLGEVMAILKRHLPLTTRGRKWVAEDIFRVLVDASARASTVESVCNELATAPDANTVFFWLKPIESQELRQLEETLNQMLVDRLPPGWITALASWPSILPASPTTASRLAMQPRSAEGKPRVGRATSIATPAPTSSTETSA